LGLSDDEIKRGLIDIKPVEHRLQPIKSEGNVLVIDDSYNANPVGVEEAIRVLGRFDGKRKIYITPGIVESGQKNKEIHTKIGHDLAKVADKVILIKNSATPFIDMGLEEKGFKKEDIIWFDTADEAHKSLGNILKPGDVILFQNDWGDQYL
jgi:UDP-N-acetylmuramoyl-tripeptide--D-alanyl-D-alanine ligase